MGRGEASLSRLPYVDVIRRTLPSLPISISASEMTYIVSGGALNSTHSFSPDFHQANAGRRSSAAVSVKFDADAAAESHHGVISRSSAVGRLLKKRAEAECDAATVDIAGGRGVVLNVEKNGGEHRGSG